MGLLVLYKCGVQLVGCGMWVAYFVCKGGVGSDAQPNYICFPHTME